MANKDLQPPQPEDNRFDSAINRLELMLHYNLDERRKRLGLRELPEEPYGHA